MSRGLGRTQRAILAHLADHDAALFGELIAACEPTAAVRRWFGFTTRRNTYESYRRAARSLETAGRIEMRKDWAAKDWRLSVARNAVRAAA